MTKTIYGKIENLPFLSFLAADRVSERPEPCRRHLPEGSGRAGSLFWQSVSAGVAGSAGTGPGEFFQKTFFFGKSKKISKKRLTKRLYRDKIHLVPNGTYALVAQLDRVTDYESVGRGFESLPSHQAKSHD